MPKSLILVSLVIFVLLASAVVLNKNYSSPDTSLTSLVVPTPTGVPDPLSIDSLKKRPYPQSEFIIADTLADGANHKRYIASYTSDGLTIYGLLTIPTGKRPESGWPAIVFMHGYLDPDVYETTDRYVAYQGRLAASGFVTFKPDLRGHGNSQGQPAQSNFSPEYIYDALNVVSAFKNYSEVNPNRIGMWGHSMGGGITLKSMVVSKDIKAGVMWAGVVGNYEDLLERYKKRIPWMNDSASALTKSLYTSFLEKNSSPSANPQFWNQIDPYAYLDQISGPVQLHHGTADDSVPVEFSVHLKEALEQAGKPVDYFEYQGADHNISGTAFTQAMNRTIEFFTRYL